MAGTVIHIPTGRLIIESEDRTCRDGQTQSEKTVLDILTPDGRNIFSIRKLVEDKNKQIQQTRSCECAFC